MLYPKDGIDISGILGKGSRLELGGGSSLCNHKKGFTCDKYAHFFSFLSSLLLWYSTNFSGGPVQLHFPRSVLKPCNQQQATERSPEDNNRNHRTAVTTSRTSVCHTLGTVLAASDPQRFISITQGGWRSDVLLTERKQKLGFFFEGMGEGGGSRSHV